MRRALPGAVLAVLLAPFAAAADVDQQTLRAAASSLDTGDWNVRMRTVHELEYMEEDGLPVLGMAAVDGDWQVRLAAVHALSPLGPKAEPYLTFILHHEPCPVVRLIALHSLGSRVPSDAEEKSLSWMLSASNDQVNDCRDQPEPGRAPWAKAAPPKAAVAAPAAPPARAAARRRRPSAEPEPPPADDVVVTPDVPAPAPPVEAPAAPPKAPAPIPPPTKDQRYAQLDEILGASDGVPEFLGDAAKIPKHRDGTSFTSVAAVRAGPRRTPAGTVIPRSTGAREAFPDMPATPSSDHASGGEAAFQAAGGKAPHDALPDLLAALKSRDSRVRARAADDLGSRGRAASPAVPLLISSLRDPSPRVRASAGLALGNIGADDKRVVPLLVKALKDRSQDVRYAATLALSRIDTPAAKDAFTRFVNENARRAIERRSDAAAR